MDRRDITARMVIDQRQKTLEGDAVVQIFHTDAAQSRTSTPCSSKVSRIGRQRAAISLECILKTLLGCARRPRVEKRPGQRSGEGGVLSGPIPGPRRPPPGLQLFRRPRLTRRLVTPHGSRGEVVKRLAVNRVYRNKLPFQMGRQLADDQPMRGQPGGDVVAVGLTLCGFLHIKICGWLQGSAPLCSPTPPPILQPVSELKGASPPINCDRKMPGPFIVLIPPP